MTLSTDTVVIAEDNLEISMMIKDYFEEVYNLTVETTDRVASILPLVKESKASVLIMDLELQDGDATEVLKDVAAIPGLIVVIFTGTYKGREENELLKNGAQVVMRKPQKPATIWQQVLNLRGIRNQRKQEPRKIVVKEAQVIYDVQKGTLVKEGGRSTILDDAKNDILSALSYSLAEYQNLPVESSDERRGSAGWVEKKEIIKTVFKCEDHKVSSYSQMFGYRLRKIIETLREYIDPEGNKELIENKRIGRYNSYYRLNPDVFEVIYLDKEEQ